MKPVLLGMAERKVQVKPVFLRDGKPIPVWELSQLKVEWKTLKPKSSSRSEAAKKAWETIRRKRGLRKGDLA